MTRGCNQRYGSTAPLTVTADTRGQGPQVKDLKSPQKRVSQHQPGKPDSTSLARTWVCRLAERRCAEERWESPG